MPVVTLVNEGKTIETAEGTNLRQLLIKNGVSPYMGKDKLLNCWGHGFCGTCRVELVDGKGGTPVGPLEESSLMGLVPFYGRKVPKNTRLSCQVSVKGDMSVKTHQPIEIDWQLTKERAGMTAIWLFFGGTLTFVLVRLLIEIATGR